MLNLIQGNKLLKKIAFHNFDARHWLILSFSEAITFNSITFQLLRETRVQKLNKKIRIRALSPQRKPPFLCSNPYPWSLTRFNVHAEWPRARCSFSSIGTSLRGVSCFERVLDFEPLLARISMYRVHKMCTVSQWQRWRTATAMFSRHAVRSDLADYDLSVSFQRAARISAYH